MPEVTVFRKNGIHHTDFNRRVVEWVDLVGWKEQWFRGQVSDGVFAILQFGSLDKHDEQVKKILEGNEWKLWQIQENK